MRPGGADWQIVCADGLAQLKRLEGAVADSFATAVHGLRRTYSDRAIARALGVTRQAVNEQLQEWKAKGWVALGRGTVILHDAAALRRRVSASR